jgi:hypothetical protein
VAGDTIGTALGAREDEGTRHVLVGKQLHQQRALLVAVDVNDALRDAVDGRCDGRDRDPGRIAQQLAGQLADLGRHGGGEEQVLAPRGKLRDDAADRRQKAQIQHLIGLVEDEDLRSRQVDIALGDVVEQPTGSGHQDATPRASAWVCSRCPTPPNTWCGEAEISAVGAEAFGDLRQAAGGA